MTPIETRQQLRQIRQSLPSSQQTQNATKAFAAFKTFIQTQFAQKSKIALFLAQDGELNTQECIEYLWHDTSHEVYLPVLKTRPNLKMAFALYQPQSKMIKNQFGIEEPKQEHGKHLTGAELDLVMVPLVGFDNQGNRLGMGGGFYDRTFEFKLEQDKANKHIKPKLIGWAHECQKVAILPKEKWDVPLNGVITENGYLEFN